MSCSEGIVKYFIWYMVMEGALVSLLLLADLVSYPTVKIKRSC